MLSAAKTILKGVLTPERHRVTSATVFVSMYSTHNQMTWIQEPEDGEQNAAVTLPEKENGRCTTSPSPDEVVLTRERDECIVYSDGEG